MKIGIITFHDDINYGAFLQTLALKKIIDSFGHDTSIINYKNIRHSILLNIVLFHKFWKPMYVLGNIKKVFLFKKSAKKLNQTKPIYLSKKLQNNFFDIVIYGSDEIWNFTNKLYSLDPVYFGKYIKAKKIAYAPSFGPISNYKVVPKNVVKLLKKINCISVRDSNSQNIITKLINKKPIKVLDPTFLYNFDNEIATSSLEIKNKFLLIYCTNISEKHKEEIINFAKSNNLEILSIGFYYEWCDINYINTGPFDFLKLFKKSSFVVTNTFHGTIFSIKYKKNFVTISSEYRKNKIYDLMKSLKLEKQIITNSREEIIGDVIAHKKIFSKASNRILKEEIKKSINYLKDSIK